MPPIRVSVERVVAAPPDIVYGILANYRDGHHQAILPPAFSDIEIVAGGVGAGTVVRFSLKLGARSRRGEARLDEPEPGRILLETATEGDTQTRFVVEPAAGGCRVRIETELRSSAGPAGIIERLLAPRLLAPLYADELARLNRYARRLVAANQPAGPGIA